MSRTPRSSARRVPRLLALIFALALIAAACGSDGEDAPAAAVTDDAPAESVDDEAMDDEEAMADDAMEDDAMAEDAMDDEDAMEDDAMDDEEAMEDDAMAEEAMEDDAMAEDAMEDDAMEDDATAEDAMEDDAMADDGVEVTVTIENIADFPISDSGAFAVPVGAAEPGPVFPGDAYEFSTYAQPGQRLSFATMFVQTNDWFFAPNPEGIALFDDDGAPISGDVTDQIFTFDSGTEIDEPVGEGADQAPRQAGPDTGAADPDPNVRSVDRDAANYVQVTVTPGDNGRFDVRIENVSETASVPSPIAPGVYAVHDDRVALFTLGEPDAGLGLEELAEDGDAGVLAESLAGLTGASTPLAPGVYATADGGEILFTLGEPDVGLGLEELAEDGDASVLGDALAADGDVWHSGVFATPDGAGEPGPALPGSAYSFSTTIHHGQRLFFATMFVQSNDWIITTPAGGLEVVDADGNLILDDLSAELLVVDAGTEVDQLPGFGADQAPRQAGPDTGAADEDASVRLVDGRSAERYVRVTVSAG